MTNPLRSRLAEARSTIAGEYSSISRVVDVLLDLRSLAAERPDVVSMLDEMMSAIPGRTVTPNEWWTSQIDSIEIQVGRSGDGNREPLITS